MAAGQSPSTSASEDREQNQGGFYGWPHSVVRWLFGLGEEHAPTAAAVIPVARFQNICISREAGSGAAHWHGWSESVWAGKFTMKN